MKRHQCHYLVRNLTGLSGKMLEVNMHEKKSQGKYSLEGVLLLKTHAALQSLGKDEAR